MNIDRVAKREPLLSTAAFAGASSSVRRDRPTSAKAAFAKLILVPAILIFLAYHPFAEAASFSGIPEGDVWSYLTRTGRGPHKWNHIGFDDSTWPRGPSGFGFGRGRFNTPVDDLRNFDTKIFVRHAFVVNNPNKVTRIILSVVSDGPFVAYINGIEIFRSRAKVTEAIDISGFAHELFPGTNVLAIEASSPNIQSDSFSFTPSLEIVED